MPNEYQSMLKAVGNIAYEAGMEIMKFYSKNYDSHFKTDGTPVTEADVAAESIILPALQSLTPEIPIVSEESAAGGHIPDISGKNFWLVDPLDGTREFIKGSDEFTVNIGLVINLEPVLGILYSPAKNVTYFGSGLGSAMKKEKGSSPKSINCREIPSKGLDVLVSRSYSTSKRLDDYLSSKKVHSRIPCGSALKFGLLAAGEADLYPRVGPTYEWDTAAGHAIILAAGGNLSTFSGNPLSYGKSEDKFLNPGFIAFGQK